MTAWSVSTSRGARAAAAAALIAAWLAPSVIPARAADPQQRLEAIERDVKQSRSESQRLQREAAVLVREVAGLRRKMIAAAKTVQAHEVEVARLEARLGELESEEAALTRRLSVRNDQAAQVLMALERLSLHPPAAIVAQPWSPAETVRGAILLRAAIPEIETRARILKDDLRRLGDTREAAVARRQALAEAMRALDAERAGLEDLLGKTSALRRTTAVESRKAKARAEALAAEARDVRDLLARLERERRAAAAKPLEAAPRQPAETAAEPSAPPISAARGTLPYPVVGRLVQRYGASAGGGLTSKGISIATVEGAQVVAPYAGRVVYAGAFRGYGQLLIIEHGEGYHSLMAGLTRIDSVIGQWVLAGEPIGVMGRAEGENPSLYVELRRNGRPINPLPWLAARKGEVSG